MELIDKQKLLKALDRGKVLDWIYNGNAAGFTIGEFTFLINSGYFDFSSESLEEIAKLKEELTHRYGDYFSAKQKQIAVLSDYNKRLEARATQAEQERDVLHAEIADGGPEGRNYTNAQFNGLQEKLRQAEQEMKELRPEVRWFAEQMELTLRKNDYKGGWKNYSLDWLMSRLTQETEEVSAALAGLSINSGNWADRLPYAASHNDVIREATDVANFAMIIADNARSIIAKIEGK